MTAEARTFEAAFSVGVCRREYVTPPPSPPHTLAVAICMQAAAPHISGCKPKNPTVGVVAREISEGVLFSHHALSFARPVNGRLNSYLLSRSGPRSMADTERRHKRLRAFSLALNFSHTLPCANTRPPQLKSV
jgi:hypothetical protein